MSLTQNSKAAEILAALQVGSEITIRHKNQETRVKLRAELLPGATKFQCVAPGTNGAIIWCELHQLVAEGVEAPVAPQPVALTAKAKKAPGMVRVENAWSADMPNELRQRMDNCEGYEDFTRDVFSATQLAKEILEDFNESGHGLQELINSRHKNEAKQGREIKNEVTQWLKTHGKVRPVEEVVALAPMPTTASLGGPERPKLAEFSQRILATLAAHGAPMLATALATAMEESIKRVAAAFTNLSKNGLIESHGGENKKGGKLIELTAAGYEYVALESYVDAGEPTVAEAGPELAPEPFKCTKAHVLAMESLLPDGRDVADIFQANLITDLEAHHPHPIAKLPTRANPDAYFFAALTVEGEDYALFMRNYLSMGPRDLSNVAITQKEIAHRGRALEEGKRAARSGAQKARHEPRGTGRAGGSRKSLPEQVLGEFIVYVNTDKMSYKEATKAAAAKLGLRATQVQNAAFKLAKSGFLATDEEGKVANPLALTERGRAGYSTNYGANLRPLIEAAILSGLTNTAVAQRVGCAISYVHDVRTKRATGYAFNKAKKERATA